MEGSSAVAANGGASEASEGKLISEPPPAPDSSSVSTAGGECRAEAVVPSAGKLVPNEEADASCWLAAVANDAVVELELVVVVGMAGIPVAILEVDIVSVT